MDNDDEEMARDDDMARYEMEWMEKQKIIDAHLKESIKKMLNISMSTQNYVGGLKMDKEIRDDRTPNNLARATCPNCSYPYDACDCEEMVRYEIEWMEKQKIIDAQRK